MVEYSDEVKKLAETLKNSGLAASMTDALEKAQSMIGTNEAMQAGKTVEDVKSEESAEPVKPVEDLDVAQTTLGNEEKDVNESVETVDEIKQEEVFVDKVETEKNPESSQNKIDLTEIFNVNK
jgi:predicted negative regulator of RcsB-dependent stress response